MSSRANRPWSDVPGTFWKEYRFTKRSVTDVVPTGISEARPQGLSDVVVVGVSGPVFVPASVQLVVEGSQDDVSYFQIAASPPSNVFTGALQTRTLNLGSAEMVDLQRFRYIRARAVTSGVGAFLISVQISGIMKPGAIIDTTMGPNVSVGGVTVDSATLLREQGASFINFQANLAPFVFGQGFGGATAIQVALQGSADGGTVWVDLATVDFGFAGGSPQSALLQQVGTMGTFIYLGGFANFRMETRDVGGVSFGYTITGLLQEDAMDSVGGDEGIDEEIDDGGGGSNAEFVTIEADAPVVIAPGVKSITFHLIQADGTPLLAVRGLKLILYDTSLAGDVDLSTNGTFNGVITAGTLVSGAATNEVAVQTSLAGIVSLQVVDPMAETIFASALDDGIPQVAAKMVVAQTVEIALVFP